MPVNLLPFIGLMLSVLTVNAMNPDSSHVGGKICGDCHEAQFAAWQNSHHDRAMMQATEDSVLGDFIQDEEIPAPDETATYNLLRDHLESVLNGLPPREVRILQLRYGLLDGQAYTLEEVGRKMGVTRERVRQIEAQALSRLRHPAVRRKLREYLG